MNGNYDYVDNATVWIGSVLAIPNSLYLSSAPAWWTFTINGTSYRNVPWPAIGSDLTPMVSQIPAQIRYAQIQAGHMDFAYPAPTLIQARIHK